VVRGGVVFKKPEKKVENLIFAFGKKGWGLIDQSATNKRRHNSLKYNTNIITKWL
jgi:hypothetical protein